MGQSCCHDDAAAGTGTSYTVSGARLHRACRLQAGHGWPSADNEVQKTLPLGLITIKVSPSVLRCLIIATWFNRSNSKLYDYESIVTSHKMEAA